MVSLSFHAMHKLPLLDVSFLNLFKFITDESRAGCYIMLFDCLTTFKFPGPLLNHMVAPLMLLLEPNPPKKVACGC